MISSKRTLGAALVAIAVLVSAPMVFAQIYTPSPTGTITGVDAGVVLQTGPAPANPIPGGYGSAAFQVTGTWVGTLQFEGSVDCAAYSSLSVATTSGSGTVTSSSGNGIWQAGVAGLQCIRVRASAWTSGTATVTMQGSASSVAGSGGGGGAAGSVTINDPSTTTQKAAVNASGQLSMICANCSGSGASALDEANFTQGTNSVAPAGGLFKTSYTALSSGQAGIFQMTSDGALYANLFKVGGTAITLGSKVSASSLPVVISSDQATVPVSLASVPSHAVTNAGTFAVQATLSGAVPAGTNVIGHVIADTGSTTAVTGTVAISAAALPLPTGASTAAKQPALGTAGSASADVISVQGIASMTALKVDGSAVTQPVSAAGLPLPTGAATSSNQTGGGQKTQIVDGSGNVIASTSNNLNVQCANCSGSGASAADNATVTESTSTFAPAGGEFLTTPGTVTTGHQSMVAITAHRAFQTSLFDAAGNALLGSKVAASSIPVVIASDQGAVAISAASLPLPTGAATATNLTGGGQKTQIVDGSGNVIASTSNNLNVQCANCSGSGASAADNASVTESTSTFAPIGGEFQTTPGTVTTGHQSMAAITAHRALQVSLYDPSGNAITPSTDATTNTATQTSGVQPFLNGSTATPSAVGADGRSIAQWGDTVGRTHITGDASMGKLLVTPDSVALPANQSVNVSQINGVTTTMGNGVSGTGVQRVTLASDSTGQVALASGSTVAVTSATAANLLARTDTSGATGAAPPARADFVGGIGSGATGGFTIGVPVCDSSKSVSMTSATTTLMITGVSGRQVRICAIHLVTAIANNVALIEGTGATCGTGTAGMAGGTTAANGWNFAANGGLTLGSGIGTVIATGTAGDSVCIITSAAGPLAGTISYTIY